MSLDFINLGKEEGRWGVTDYQGWLTSTLTGLSLLGRLGRRPQNSWLHPVSLLPCLTVGSLRPTMEPGNHVTVYQEGISRCFLYRKL